MQDNRIEKVFAQLRSEGRKALLPFLTAGYPDTESTGMMLSDIESRGIRICELGFPFSDPIADGATIQASYTRALEKGVTVQKILDTVGAYREGGGDMGLLAMVSYSIVFRRCPETFCADAAAAGFDGVIVPDLPLEESGDVARIAAGHDLCAVMLISPTTPPERRIELAKASTGFVYFMSVAGITGERKQLPESTFEAVAELRTHVEVPVCIGFGISSAAMVEQACEAGDGAIVGSAIIHRINDAVEQGASREEVVETVGGFVSRLNTPLV
jgi:tryptophan synthase alpha chain